MNNLGPLEIIGAVASVLAICGVLFRIFIWLQRRVTVLTATVYEVPFAIPAELLTNLPIDVAALKLTVLTLVTVENRNKERGLSDIRVVPVIMPVFARLDVDGERRTVTLHSDGKSLRARFKSPEPKGLVPAGATWYGRPCASRVGWSMTNSGRASSPCSPSAAGGWAARAYPIAPP